LFTGDAEGGRKLRARLAARPGTALAPPRSPVMVSPTTGDAPMILRTVLLGGLLAAGPAYAANDAAPKPPATTIPEKIAPGAEPSGPAKNLSDKLNASGGVIAPKEVDPGMDKTTPSTADPNVVRPPGTGADPAPQAK
jgi:hypothetical protein